MTAIWPARPPKLSAAMRAQTSRLTETGRRARAVAADPGDFAEFGVHRLLLNPRFFGKYS